MDQSSRSVAHSSESVTSPTIWTDGIVHARCVRRINEQRGSEVSEQSSGRHRNIKPLDTPSALDPPVVPSEGKRHSGTNREQRTRNAGGDVGDKWIFVLKRKVRNVEKRVKR